MQTLLVEEAQLLQLRRQAEYWQALHHQATERAEYWKETAAEYKSLSRERLAKIATLLRDLEDATLRIDWLERQLFGCKSEKAAKSTGPESGGEKTLGDVPESKEEGSQPARRGKQPGTKGHGRRRREDLPREDHLHDLAEEDKRCPICGRLFYDLGTEDSDLIDWEVRIVRQVHRRKRYYRPCSCPVGPKFITATGPAKLIPKGLFTNRFWVELLLEKYLFQRPLYRVRRVLALQGLDVSQGVLTGGLKRIRQLLQPVYGRILDRVRTAEHWQMDETRWFVWEEVEGKKGYRWWLWVVVTGDSVGYLLDPSRSAEVPRNLLGDQAEGKLSVDRYSAYQSLGEKIELAFCWSHVRRDYVRIRDGCEPLRSWAEGWIERIRDLFHLNAERLKVRWDPQAFELKNRLLRHAVDAMAAQREGELADPTLHPTARRALKSLRKHWEGCTLFVDHPEIPMDNNECERQLRNPVVGRKNYYGSGSVWSAALTAILFTLFQTLVKNRLNPESWLRAYFEACAKAGGKAPEDIDSFLPWNLSEGQKEAWALPEPFT